jgi:predicted Zn-dependent protease
LWHKTKKDQSVYATSRGVNGRRARERAFSSVSWVAEGKKRRRKGCGQWSSVFAGKKIMDFGGFRIMHRP